MSTCRKPKAPSAVNHGVTIEGVARWFPFADAFDAERLTSVGVSCAELSRESFARGRIIHQGASDEGPARRTRPFVSDVD